MPVAQEGLVPLDTDITQDIRPRDGVGASDKIWMRDGTKRLADVGCVGYITVGREENGADAVGVGCISVGRVC